MSEIEELTQEQKIKMEDYISKWTKIGTSTERLDRQAAEKAIRWAYKFASYNGDSVKISFYDSVDAAQKAAQEATGEKTKQSFMTPSLDSWWVGFYDFLLHEVVPEKQSEYREFLEECIPFYKNVFYIIAYDTHAFVSERPTSIKLDDQGRLHNYNGPAMEFSDGHKIYAINNTPIPAYIAETSPEDFTKDMFLKEKNVDFRRFITTKIGIEKTIELLGADVVDIYESDVGGRYELLMVDYTNTGEKRPYLKMINKSIGEFHIEGVHPSCKTVQEALNFRNGLRKFVEPENLS